MHQRPAERGVVMQQWPTPEPVEQLVTVVRRQDFIERILLLLLGGPGGYRQQVQVVVAKDAHGAFAQALDEPQRFQRLRTAVDEIAGKPERIVRLIEADFFEQRLQGIEAALHVADGVRRHSAGAGRGRRRAASSMPACTSALTMPGSVAEWPASGMISSFACGQAWCRSQALWSGQTMS